MEFREETPHLTGNTTSVSIINVLADQVRVNSRVAGKLVNSNIHLLLFAGDPTDFVQKPFGGSFAFTRDPLDILRVYATSV